MNNDIINKRMTTGISFFLFFNLKQCLFGIDTF